MTHFATITSLSGKRKLLYLTIAVVIICTVFVALQTLTRAALYAAAAEGESGTVGGQAHIVSDPDSAGGAYLQFGSPSPTPTPTPSSSPSPTPTTGSILWQDKFDTAPVGQLTKASGDSLFAPTVSPTNTDTYTAGSIINDGPNNAGKALHQKIPAGQLGPFIVSPKLPRETDHATVEYNIRFDSNFDWRWGGKMGPGLVGVAPGHDIYEPTSGNPDRNVGFSTRLMWHGRGDDGTRPFQSKLGPIPTGRDNDVVTYIYARYPNENFSGFGWETSLNTAMLRGTWQHVKLEVKLNTIGKQDGIFRAWIDGSLRVNASNFDYRGSNTHIQAILWDIHRGGGTTPPSWVSSRDTYVDLANVIVREQP